MYGITWKNVVEPGRPQMTIWRTRIACWIPKATNTHSQYIREGCHDELNTSSAWWKCNKHNSFKQVTSLEQNTQYLHLITTQSGTPQAVQCSSSRTYCSFHFQTFLSICLSLRSVACCDWAHSLLSLLWLRCHLPTLCLTYTEVPQPYLKHVSNMLKKLN